jgi:hypothetical protein
VPELSFATKVSRSDLHHVFGPVLRYKDRCIHTHSQRKLSSIASARDFPPGGWINVYNRLLPRRFDLSNRRIGSPIRCTERPAGLRLHQLCRRS